MDSLQLYALEDVRVALGQRRSIGNRRSDVDLCPEWAGDGHETEHQARLATILAAGPEGALRKLLGPTHLVDRAILDLTERAPHMGMFGELAARHMRAAAVMRTPAALPPVLLLGRPGTGKTWFASRLANLMGVPFRRYAMCAASLNEGLQGSHPSWRNASTGLVAKTLLSEESANPVIFVDEFDKAGRNASNTDPYRTFYGLLDPSDAKRHCDEYLGFDIDASHVVWIMAANAVDDIPEPILDRLTVIDVPELSREQTRRIAQSVYVEANIAKRSFFDEEPSGPVIDKLVEMTPRAIRKAVDDAMIRAAAEARQTLRREDVHEPMRTPGRTCGFLQRSDR